MKRLAKAALFTAITVTVNLLQPVSPANAASGTATGTLRHFNRQGNFCPTGRDCTGAKYLQSEFNTYRPIRHVKVYVRDDNDTIIGQGATDLDGNFGVNWYSPVMPASIHVTWHAEHFDDRFTIYSSNGGTWHFWTTSKAAVSGGATSFGTLHWGSPGSPHDITNWYDGAHRMWWDSLWWSFRMQSEFTNVSIYVGSPNCPTSCANGDSNEVWMDPNSAYAPQERIMHEMGHVASDRAHEGGNYWQMADYCWPSTGGGCTWTQTSAEWRQSAMEEATASIYATFALYGQNATAPHDCLVSQAACSTNVFNLETSSGTSCAANEDRWQLTLARTFWDMHDTNQDSVSGFTDHVSASIDSITESFARFPNGRANRQKNEGWACLVFEELGSCWPDDRDARNMYDFRAHYSDETGHPGYSQLYMNCL